MIHSCLVAESSYTRGMIFPTFGPRRRLPPTVRRGARELRLIGAGALLFLSSRTSLGEPPQGNLRAPPQGNLRAPAPMPASLPSLQPGTQMPPGPGPEESRQSPTEPAERVTFAEAVRRSLTRNPTVAVALAEIRRFEGLMKEVRASSLPILTGNVAYTNLDSDRRSGGTLVAGANQINANLSLTVPLLAPQHWVQWAQARDNVEVARVSAEEARRQVAISTARAYLLLVSQHRIIDVQTRAVQNARAHLSFSRSRYAGGVGTRLDEVRAAQEVSTDQVQLQNAYTALARAREALGVFIASDHPVDVADDAPMAPIPALAEAAKEVSGRTDVRAQVRRERAADRVYRNRWADYLPYLTGTFQPFYQNPPTLTLPTWGYQAMLVLTVPFYDGGFRYGASREREALASEARSNLEGLLRQANSDVRAAFESLFRWTTPCDRPDAARFAEEALGLANLAYRAGATTNIEVIDAERVARDAETAATVAEDAARQARLNLLIASGRFP